MTTRIAPLTLGTVAVLTLAACGGPESAGDSSPDGPATPASDTEPTASAASAPDSEDGDPQSFGACPEGRWLLDNDDWSDAMEDTMPAGTTVDSVEGRVWITHQPDGTYIAEYDDWDSQFSTADGTMVMERDGVDTGTWSESNGTITVTEVARDSEFVGYIETEQGRMNLPTGGDDATGITGEFNYECPGGDTMVTNTDGMELDFTRD